MNFMNKKIKRMTQAVLHKVDLWFILVACAIILSMKCRLIIKIPKLIRLQINSSKEVLLAMLNKEFQDMPIKVFPASI